MSQVVTTTSRRCRRGPISATSACWRWPTKHGATIEPKPDRPRARCFRCRAGCRSRSARRNARPIAWSSSRAGAMRSAMPINLQPKFAASSGDLAIALDPRGAGTAARSRRWRSPARSCARRLGRGARHRRRSDARQRSPAASASTPAKLAARRRRAGDRRALRRSRRRRRSTPAFSARRGTSAAANRSGARTGSTFWTANWQNSVLLPAAPDHAGEPARCEAGRRERRGLSRRDAPQATPCTGAAPQVRIRVIHATLREGYKPCPHGLIFALVCAVAAHRLRRRLDQLDPGQARRQRRACRKSPRRSRPARRPTSTAST